MSKTTIRAIFLAGLASQSILFAQPTVGPTTINPPQAAANVPTTVVVTAAIADPSYIPGSANLQRIDTGGVASVIGVLRDDGTGGDAAAGDKVFTASVVVSEPQPGQIPLRVSAAFLGKLRRSLSPVFYLTIAGPEQNTVNVRGTVFYDSGRPVAGAQVFAGLTPDVPVARPVTSTLTVTDPQGKFSANVLSLTLPVRIVAQIKVLGPPEVDTARWGVATGAVLDLGRIVIPNPAGSQIPIVSGSGQSGDGSVKVSGLPAAVTQLNARSYDPDANPDAFPGEFAEQGNIPLNSSVFLWAEARGANGSPIDTFAQPITFRVKVPRTQWPDLEDINAGSDRIEIPIYFFNETTQLWEQEGVGWLEDSLGTVLPEDAQPTILDGSFPREIYATFLSTHLSWKNVDYAYIGPWTLSRIPAAKRNNDCLYTAMQLAKTIAKSTAGRNAYAKVNAVGGDLNVELADRAGPELKSSDLEWTNSSQTNGEYTGDAAGGSESELFLNNKFWDLCDEAGKKNAAILMMASTLLHETAHWKDDVKKFPDSGDTTPPDGPKDTRGEEGKQLEKDIFGGDLHYDPVDGRLELDGNPVTEEQMNNWLKLSNWPAAPGATSFLTQAAAPRVAVAASPLQITLSQTQTSFSSGDSIPVTVEYKNVSAAPIAVVNRILLEDYPLRFDITHSASGKTVGFLGGERDTSFGAGDYVTVPPGGTLVKVVDLNKNENGQYRRYNLRLSGLYRVVAVYSPYFGLPETASNSIEFSLTAFGTVAGAVTNSLGQPVASTVTARQGDNVVQTVNTAAGGAYSMILPPGTYDLEAASPGYLRTTRTGVVVVASQTVTVNFALSPLPVAGEMRIILTWGANPRDLDSHLWLPPSVPYHIYYSRKGVLDKCPNAQLDIDDTNGFGPETTTIRQRYASGNYVFAVHLYSGSGSLSTSGAQVQVFDQTGLKATFTPPAQGSGVWWHVLTISGATGAITGINQIVGDSPAPYPDTTSGCAATM